jgi:hypothetical protein
MDRQRVADAADLAREASVRARTMSTFLHGWALPLIPNCDYVPLAEERPLVENTSLNPDEYCRQSSMNNFGSKLVAGFIIVLYRGG